MATTETIALPAEKFPPGIVGQLPLESVLTWPEMKDTVTSMVARFSRTHDGAVLTINDLLDPNFARDLPHFHLSLAARVLKGFKIVKSEGVPEGEDPQRKKKVGSLFEIEEDDGFEKDDEQKLKKRLDDIGHLIEEIVMANPRRSNDFWTGELLAHLKDLPDPSIKKAPPSNGRVNGATLKPTPKANQNVPPPPPPPPVKPARQCTPFEITRFLRLRLLIPWKNRALLDALDTFFSSHRDDKGVPTVGRILDDPQWKSRGLNQTMIWTINHIMASLSFEFSNGDQREKTWSELDQSLLGKRLNDYDRLVAAIAENERGEPAELGKLLNERLDEIKVIAPMALLGKTTTGPTSTLSRAERKTLRQKEKRDGSEHATSLPPTPTPTPSFVKATPTPAPTPTPTSNNNPENGGELKRRVARLRVDRIRPLKNQPRQFFDQKKIEELAQNLKKRGQRNLIIVRPVEEDPDADWELIGGERRWRACIEGGIKFIDAEIDETTASKKEIHLKAFVDNVFREGLGHLETSDAILNLLTLGATREELAEDSGLTLRMIANYEKLFVLCEPLRERMRPGVDPTKALGFKTALSIATAYPNDHPQQILCMAVASGKQGNRQSRDVTRYIEAKQQGFRSNNTSSDKSGGQVRVPSRAHRNIIAMMAKLDEHADALNDIDSEHLRWIFRDRPRTDRDQVVTQAEEIAKRLSVFAATLKAVKFS